jgi:hypothetical protein
MDIALIILASTLAVGMLFLVFGSIYQIITINREISKLEIELEGLRRYEFLKKRKKELEDILNDQVNNK